MTTAIAEPILTLPHLNILHVGKFYPPHMGGMETHLQALCENLQPFANVRVLVANGSRQTTEDSVHGVNVKRVGTLFNFSAAAVCPGMVTEIRRSKADIVHLHLPNPMATVAYLVSGHRGKLVITYHSDVVRQKLLARIFQPILYSLLKRCSAIIATSPNYIATSRVLRDFRDRCQVIPYGIPVDQFQLSDRALVERIREKHGDRLVLSVGRLVYYKGFEYLIRAMAKVRGRLLIIGDGPLRGSLEQLAKDCGVADRVVFLGEVQNEDTIPYYHAADLFALASIARSEAFGIVQLEAMACGKPVVNTWLDSGVPFVSLDEVSGLTVLPMDSDALAGAINVLLDDTELRAKYGASARKRVREKFALDVMTRRMLQLYAQVAGQQTDWANGLVMDEAEKGLVGGTVGVTAGASACISQRE